MKKAIKKYRLIKTVPCYGGVADYLSMSSNDINAIYLRLAKYQASQQKTGKHITGYACSPPVAYNLKTGRYDTKKCKAQFEVREVW